MGLILGQIICSCAMELHNINCLKIILFFLDSKKSHLLESALYGPSKRVKPWLSQALTRNTYYESNSRSAPLPSRHTPWGPKNHTAKPYKLSWI